MRFCITISANPIITAGGNTAIIAEANYGSATKRDSIKFFVVAGITIAPLPAGVKDGINYRSNNTEVTLVLYAPGKNRVSSIGELAENIWTEQSQYQMNKTPDGNYWWLTITGLTSGNITVIQTNAPSYNWQTTSFIKPDKRNLIIYELLLRDYTDAHNWQTMIDTLSYLQRHGVNALELMPVNEFEGNDSWGYNPSFYFAPGIYYGTKNKLKQFIDSCHTKQIAVILDMVPNHRYGQSRLVQLYWNSGLSWLAASNQ